MIGLGALRVVVAVFGTVVGWIFVGQIAAASDDSLEVTVQTLDAVDDTIDLAEVHIWPYRSALGQPCKVSVER